MQFILLGLISLVTFNLVAAAEETSDWRLDTKSIDRFVATYRNQYQVPGVAVVVTSGDRIVYAEGHGHDSTGRPISSTTRFPIASLSKSFTALAVMQLAESGKLNLDDPVHRYLPDFSLADPRGKRITIRQLLEHTSGMSDLAFPEKSVSTPSSLKDAVAILLTARLVAEPGTRRIYHNPNYWIAARLVEVVSGQAFEIYLAEEILAPLEMHDTFAVASLTPASGVANGYIRIFGYPIALREPAWFLGGCAGIVTTATDMGRWLAFHNTGRTPSGDRLISAAGLDALHQSLGWNAQVREGQKIFTHNGFLFTFNARQYVVPDVANGLGIAVMANTGAGLAPLDSDAIGQAVMAIVERRSPGSAGPSSFLVDMVLGSLCLITLVWGAFALRRSKRWANARLQRARWQIVVSLLPYLIPVLLLACYPDVVGRAAGGRDLSWTQSLYLSALLFVLVAVLAMTSVTVLAARVAALWRISMRLSDR